jgi:hypothetical protein
VDRRAAEVAGLLGDGDPARRPAALRRPGPQPCNQIPPTYADAMRRLHAGRPRWPHLRLWLRLGRAARRVARAVLRPELRVIVGELRRLRRDLDAATGRAGS